MGDLDEPPPREVLLRPKDSSSEIATLNPAVAQKNPGDTDLFIYPRVDIGRGRRTYRSYIGYVEAQFDKGGVVVDHSSRRPLLVPSDSDESYEDARSTVIDGCCYLTYVKVNRRKKTVDTCLAMSDDFVNFQEFGVISPSLPVPRALELIGSKKRYSDYHRAWFETYKAKAFWRDATLDFKNFAFFPEKINGKFGLPFRVLPNVLFLLVEDLRYLKKGDFWEDVFLNLDEHVLIKPVGGCESWQVNRVGIGPPPIKKGEDWLLVYHGVRLSPKRYCMGAAVLDKNMRLVRRTREPFLVPRESWQRNGIKNEVVYLTGSASNGGFHFFGGAADTVSFQVGPYDLEKIVEKCEPV